ncbi:DNA-3-methyladenine glycosylase family protein [Oxobacter pfennigii]|nr:DNA glycosylase [Oxobacter pfennigii]
MEDGGKVIIENIRDFEPKHVFDCGQCFRWYEEGDGSYTGVVQGRVINVKKDGQTLVLDNTDKKEFDGLWYDYFDMGRDYGKIKNELSEDDTLKEAIGFGEGIRILKQDEWETLISFIISANNRIPMIKRAIKEISEKWGKPVVYKGNTYHSFPSPQDLKDASVEDFESCHTGFRAKYIKKTVEMVINKEIDLYNLKNLTYAEARNELMKLPGVGPKVSDCILLFSMYYYEAFPVDVWVKRVMQHFYLAPDVSLPKIEKFGQEKFKKLAGFAQQYLFYYARDLKGKEISV